MTYGTNGADQGSGRAADVEGIDEAGLRFVSFFGSFVASIKEQFSAPRDFYARLANRRNDLLQALVFALVCGLIGVALAFVASLLLPELPPVLAPDTPAFDPQEAFANLGSAGMALALAFGLTGGVLLGAIGLLIDAVVLHLLVVIFVDKNERGGFDGSFKVACYSNVVTLISWLPVVGYLATIYGLVLTFMGVRSLHGASSGRALAIVLVLLVLLVAVPLAGTWL